MSFEIELDLVNGTSRIVRDGKRAKRVRESQNINCVDLTMSREDSDFGGLRESTDKTADHGIHDVADREDAKDQAAGFVRCEGQFENGCGSLVDPSDVDESGEDLDAAKDGRIDCPTCRGAGRVAAEETEPNSIDASDLPSQRIAAARRARAQ